MRKGWWNMAQHYTEEPWRRGFSSSTPCAQSRVHVFPYSKGRGLKKPSGRIYIHTQRENSNHSSSWVCPGSLLYFPVPSQYIHESIILGASTDQGVHWAQLSQMGRGQRRSFCFFWVGLKRNSSSLFPPSTEKEIKSMQKSLRGRKGAQVPAFLQQELIIAEKNRSFNPGPDGCSSLKEETLTSE